MVSTPLNATAMKDSKAIFVNLISIIVSVTYASMILTVSTEFSTTHVTVMQIIPEYTVKKSLIFARSNHVRTTAAVSPT